MSKNTRPGNSMSVSNKNAFEVSSTIVKIEPIEMSSLNTDDMDSCSNEDVEVKEEIGMKYDPCYEQSGTSWYDSKIKMEIDETDLKGERSSEEIDRKVADDLLKIKTDDFKNVPFQLTEEVFIKEEKNSELSEKEQLEDLKPLHMSEKPHKCDICSKSFTRKNILNAHILIHTGDKHKCDVCGKQFKIQYLKTHMLLHTGEKPYKCDICEISFIHRNTHITHMRTHTGDTPHKCDICGKSFYQKYHLNTHKLTHTGEKRYKCNFCDKFFTQLGHLKTHTLIHTGEKPHKCYVCEKSFNRKNSLKAHIILHTGEKPHKCEICEKSFSHRDNLKKHMVTHTDDTPHKCNICEKSFKLKSSFKRHLLTHKGSDTK